MAISLCSAMTYVYVAGIKNPRYAVGLRISEPLSKGGNLPKMSSDVLEVKHP